MFILHLVLKKKKGFKGEKRGKGEIEKVKWSQAKIYFLAVNVDVNTVRFMIWWPKGTIRRNSASQY